MSATEPKKTVTRVSADGEVVLPAELGSAKRWAPGTEVEIVARGEGYVVRKHSAAPDPRPKITWEEFLARIPKYQGPYITDVMMHEAIEEEARRRWDAEDRG